VGTDSRRVFKPLTRGFGFRRSLIDEIPASLSQVHARATCQLPLLLGALASCDLARLKALPQAKLPANVIVTVVNVIVAVMTDGLENGSREWTRDAVMAAVKDRIDAGWHFTFIGANQDAIQEGERLGVDPNASMNFQASPAASRAAMGSLSASVGRMRRGEAAGIGYTEEERRRASGN